MKQYPHITPGFWFVEILNFNPYLHEHESVTSRV